jgi:flagellar biosynthetic protein FliQ
MLTSDVAVDLTTSCLRLVMLLVCVLVVPGLIVGLLIGLLQAATQVQDQTLTFLPRLLVTLLVITLTGHWIAAVLSDFCISVFKRAAMFVG